MKKPLLEPSWSKVYFIYVLPSYICFSRLQTRAEESKDALISAEKELLVIRTQIQDVLDSRREVASEYVHALFTGAADPDFRRRLSSLKIAHKE